MPLCLSFLYVYIETILLFDGRYWVILNYLNLFYSSPLEKPSGPHSKQSYQCQRIHNIDVMKNISNVLNQDRQTDSSLGKTKTKDNLQPNGKWLQKDCSAKNQMNMMSDSALISAEFSDNGINGESVIAEPQGGKEQISSSDSVSIHPVIRCSGFSSKAIAVKKFVPSTSERLATKHRINNQPCETSEYDVYLEVCIM